MPMYPYGGVSENAPAAPAAAEIGHGGSNEVIPPAAAGSDAIPQGFPLPGAGLPSGIFDSSYSGSGQTFNPPSESAPPAGGRPSAPPVTT